MNTWLSLLPPLIAISLALISRQVFLSLFAGIWAGFMVLAGGDPLAGLADAIDGLVAVFASAYNARVILFSALIGGLLTLTQASGGVEGFVAWMRRRRLGATHRGAGLVAVFVGLLIFIESSITALVVGAVSRPLADEAKMSSEKLAYLCDSTSAPVCILIPLNAWGAYVMGLLALQGVEAPLWVMLKTIPLNFYALAALGLAAFVAFTGWDFGPMKAAERRAREEGKRLADGATPMIAADILTTPMATRAAPQARQLLIPLAAMIAMMPLGLYLTGAAALTAQGKPLEFFAIMGAGSGSKAVLWAVLAGLSAAALLARIQRILSLREIIDQILRGAGGLMPMAVIMMLAFALNDVCGQLKTGPWIAELARPYLSAGLLPVLLFLTSALIAFSTGTSWGTFGIMTPIGVPLALGLDGGLTLAVAAILSGGVFGDHCSPISDTTVISSMATASDHIDHVRTQLPYALLSAGIAAMAFLVMGLIHA
ncbi:sodium:solute symporter [Myxococcota bacterium]|nr:sodium:solute symporter [Myxococcota bacterium]MBU1430210.1 sodium:solute symporter [Myxococcota bacterium]MBU1897916.1 sodium:solute symporter [Myxococcota bacterium]